MGIIRLANVEDAREISEIYRPYVLDSAATFETEPPTPGEFARRIEATSVMYPYIVYEDDGRIDGYAYASAYHERKAYRFSVTTSVYLPPRATGKGLGKKLYRVILDILRAQGYWNVYAVITVPNPASIALNEAFGFRRAGLMSRCGYKQGEWRDVAILELSLRPGVGEPVEPVPLSGLDATLLQRILDKRD